MAQPFSLRHHRVLALTLATALLAGGGTSAGIALGTLPAASAQDQPAGGPPPGASRGRMGKVLMSLNLSDEQKTRIRAIMADTRKQNATITDRDQKRANYKAAMAKVETVLTPAQRTEFHTKLEAMRQQDQPPHS